MSAEPMPHEDFIKPFAIWKLIFQAESFFEHGIIVVVSDLSCG